MTASAPQTLAIAAHKGGVGKTTTALAVASALARSGHLVVLVDLDPQGHTTKCLQVDPDDDRPTVGDLFLEQPAEIGQCTRPTTIERLAIAPATLRLARVVEWLYGPNQHKRLKEALDPVAGAMWIVIDCPPQLGPLVWNALEAADRVIIPARMEARATDGIADLLDTQRKIKGRAFDAWRILRTMRDPRDKTSNAATEAALQARYAAHLFATIIPKNDALNQAQIAKVDIFEFDPTCAGAKAYVELVNEVIAWRVNDSIANV